MDTVSFGTWFISFSELMDNPLPQQQREPTLKGAPLGIIPELGHMAGNSNDGFLHGVLGFRLAQTALQRHPIKQLPVRLEEPLPAGSVSGISKPFQKAAPRGQQIVRALSHA